MNFKPKDTEFPAILLKKDSINLKTFKFTNSFLHTNCHLFIQRKKTLKSHVTVLSSNSLSTSNPATQLLYYHKLNENIS